ncbi:hypothetical protein WR25_08315 [Diploscapter pachys]|uniref:Thiamin pyrophosphokinase thiamin-binding domain-containing protein n=1 Tax=Diploscapter pachys TaxID=2018661 RepID=A0A2A2L081_9BILA|nr:hypothetical protein WR25_08315 [Diploscapter pachys]
MKGESTCIWLNGPMTGETAKWRQLWNEARRRYLTDGAANVIMKRQDHLQVPHVISGDFDSVDAEKLKEWENICKVIHTPDQDHNDLYKAIHLMAIDAENPVKRIVILGGLQGRFDHVMQTVNTLLKAREHFGFQVFVLDGVNIAFVVGEGESQIEVDRSFLTNVAGIIPICQKKTMATTKGLKWDVENTILEFGGLVSSSNELASDKISIKSTAPLLITLELEESILVNMLKATPKELLLCVFDRLDHRSAARLLHANNNLGGAVRRHLEVGPAMRFFYARFWRCVTNLEKNTEFVRVDLECALVGRKSKEYVLFNIYFGNDFKEEDCKSVDDLTDAVYGSFGKTGIPTEQTLSDGRYRKLQLFELKCKDDPENYESLFKFCELALPYIEIESASHYYLKFAHQIRLEESLSKYRTTIYHKDDFGGGIVFNEECLKALKEKEIMKGYRTAHFHVRNDDFPMELLLDEFWKGYPILSIDLCTQKFDILEILSKAHAQRLAIYMRKLAHYAEEKLPLIIRYIHENGLQNVDCLVQGFNCYTPIATDIYDRLVGAIPNDDVIARRQLENSPIELVNFKSKNSEEMILWMKRCGKENQWIIIKIQKFDYKQSKPEQKYYYRYWSSAPDDPAPNSIQATDQPSRPTLASIL